MKTKLIIFLLLINSMIFADYELKQLHDFYDIGNNGRLDILLDVGKYYPYVSILTNRTNNPYFEIILEYKNNMYNIKDSIDSAGYTIGHIDIDNNLKNEIISILNTGDYLGEDRFFTLSEQSDTISLDFTPNYISMDFLEGLIWLYPTGLIKNKPTIVGAPPMDSDTGWFYMEYDSTGDSLKFGQVYNAYYDGEYRSMVSSMCICRFDDDSLTDVIMGTSRGQEWWEATDAENDSFAQIDSFECPRVGTTATFFAGDLDRDGRNEFIIYGGVALMLPCEWAMGILEYNGTDTVQLIYEDTLKKDYGAYPNVLKGSDADTGDIDGDGYNELIYAAGCFLKVYKTFGDNDFRVMWEIDNDTFSGSNVSVYDFNGNGRAEIIWSGASYEDLPLTYGMDVQKTYIFEYDSNYSYNVIDSARGLAGRFPEAGVTRDDYVQIFFNWDTDMPEINSGNIDSILRLSNGHTWLDGNGDITQAVWIGGKKLTIQFSDSLKNPTIDIGDTIYVDTMAIWGTRVKKPFKNPVVLTGSFGPTGIQENREPCALSLGTCTCTVPTIKSQYIIWNTTMTSTLIVYDISGRELIREESKTNGEHKTDIRALKNGIYFIKLSTENQSIIEKMVRIK
ncbi:MAG: T9SS type A sorting domain-containing protein [bacterium]